MPRRAAALTAGTAAAIAIVACGTFADTRTDLQNFAEIEKGRYLVSAADCIACHTVWPNGAHFAGGRPIETPFGNIVSANITPDRETGIGSWSDDQFDDAVRRGIRPNGARLYPAMPYPYYTKMSREDVLAIRAYLKTVEPVRNPVVTNTLPFPFNIRTSMRVWNVLFFKEERFKADPQKSDVWNRGAFLVEGPGHCGACHTPKNIFGADKRGSAFAGGKVAGWFAPRLDGATRSGLKSWSADDIVEYLQSGRNARSHADGLMAEVVVNSTSRMSDGDVRAIAVYLKSLPSGAPEAQVTPPPEAAMASGKALYNHACIACHELDGSGAPRIYPPLPGNALLQSDDPSSTLRIMLDGAHTVTTPRAPNTGEMPGYAKQWSDQQIADVTNYIRNSWGNAAPLVTTEQVAKARKQ
jgi:mono/diheme cytochrome c family protein